MTLKYKVVECITFMTSGWIRIYFEGESRTQSLLTMLFEQLV